MTEELVMRLCRQVEVMDWYRTVVQVAVNLQEDGVYAGEDAVAELVKLAREMAASLGVSWRE